MKDEVEGWLQGKTGIRRHKKELNETKMRKVRIQE